MIAIQQLYLYDFNTTYKEFTTTLITVTATSYEDALEILSEEDTRGYEGYDNYSVECRGEYKPRFNNRMSDRVIFH